MRNKEPVVMAIFQFIIKRALMINKDIQIFVIESNAKFKNAIVERV